MKTRIDHHVKTACPLDCPDSCTLSVDLHDGRIVAIDGGRDNPTTAGFICGKVRRFAGRVNGPDRLLQPGIRTGPKGSGEFRWIEWDDALERVAEVLRAARQAWGGESILPYCYGGSNGLLTQDSIDARLFRRLGASRIARTLCASATGAANMALYGKMPSVTYEDYAHARLIVVWGANPSSSGIHLVPYIRAAQKAGTRLVVVDPRSTPLARLADLHVPVRPGTDVAVALALHRYLFEEGLADSAFLEAHTRGAGRLRERASEWTFEKAAEISGVPASLLEQFAGLYASTAPAVIRCGWGQERNRNGGNATAAILALPAVGGKFGVRGGGFSMSNSASWGIEKTWVGEDEPATRVINMNHLGRELVGGADPAIRVLFVYNCNPAATVPHQNLVLEGLAREDLYTIVFDQVMTDTARYADLVLPATTFLEQYDVARAYGPLSIQMVQPVIDAVGQARPNADVFAEIESRLGFTRQGEAGDELEMMLKIMDELPPHVSEALRNERLPSPEFGPAPVQFVDVFPRTPDGRIDLFPEALEREAPLGLYTYQPDPATEAWPLALISPSTEKTISSSLGELMTKPAVLTINPADARPRGIAQGDEVRVFNELGEVRCVAEVSPLVRPGTLSLPKGLWMRSTANGSTANALAPDTLTDLGAGACFNDARVQVERIDPGIGDSALREPQGRPEPCRGAGLGIGTHTAPDDSTIH